MYSLTMSTERLQQEYRERLSKGDIVYLVEGESIVGSGPLTVKKGRVSSVALPLPGETVRRYPRVDLWDGIDEGPKVQGINVAKSPRELFTEDEVKRAVVQYEGPLGSDSRPVDELITDPIARQELTGILGGVVMARLAQDELGKAGDPEY